jgi:hypothetical protein
LNNLNNGKAMNRINKKDSTPMNNQNKMVLPDVDNHKKYSINKVKMKYNKPNPIKRMTPFISSLV